ncbi:MAG: hypothetical protein ACXWBZ_18625 [Usitatibacter sp.]
MKDLEHRKPSPAYQKAKAEIERRMRAAAEEILRSDWAAYAAATVPERKDEYEQILKDMVSLPMLNKRNLLAEYLQVIASTQYQVETTLEANLPIADKLIAFRRETELDVTPEALFPTRPVSPPGPGAMAWKIVSRIVAVIGALIFTAFAAAALFDGSVSMGARVGWAVFSLGAAAMLIFIFFFRGAASSRDASIWQERVRRDIEIRYEKE